VLHFGHLVQRPSGISRFLDLDPSFGFLAKVVEVLETGGGVTAGSADSNPSVFLMNEVAILSYELRVFDFEFPAVAVTALFISNYRPYYSKSARYCPDTNFTRTGLPQHPGAGTRGRAGGKNVVQ
jgi:hypothetical protein